MGPVGLLEREGELATTGDAIDGCVGGAGRPVELEGPAGIGKTRLLTAASRVSFGSGHALLSARGSTLERSFAYGVVRQLFEPAPARSTVEEKDEAFAGAAALAPPLFETLPVEATRVSGGGTAAIHTSRTGRSHGGKGNATEAAAAWAGPRVRLAGSGADRVDGEREERCVSSRRREGQ